jgi:3-carboxy-cis,cis-muconate cycloisomerase
MTGDLFWPGDERAGDLFGAERFLAALTSVEEAWLNSLVSVGIAPPEAAAELQDLISSADVEPIAHAAEAGGNPVIPLVAVLRDRLGNRNPTAATWLHQGLTSQDVVDTALVRCSFDVLDRLRREFTGQVGSLRALSDTHRGTLMAGRTLSQFAVPITFGLKAAGWLQGILDAAEAARDVRLGLRSQFGGAAGTLAATVELVDRAERADRKHHADRKNHADQKHADRRYPADRVRLSDPARRAENVVAEASRRLGLATSPPWHTSRAPLTRIGDALVGCNDAWGRLATDVITLSRPEIAEVAEPTGAGRGTSSTMPQKRNPVLSVLIRRCALTAPMLGAQLHLAAADAGDERPAGAWHTEWATLRTLARATVVAASQSTELLLGLQVDPLRMFATLEAASPGILAERLKAGPVGLTDPSTTGDPHSPTDTDRLDPRGYLGTSELTIDATLARAEKFLLLEG